MLPRVVNEVKLTQDLLCMHIKGRRKIQAELYLAMVKEVKRPNLSGLWEIMERMCNEQAKKYSKINFLPRGRGCLDLVILKQ